MWRKLLRGLGCLGYVALLGVICAFVSYVSFSLFVRRGITPTPDLAGLPEEQARALLVDQGLRFSWSGEDERYDADVPAGYVLDQKPPAATLVKRGSAVTVVLSRGQQRIEVPPVVGQALQAAQVTLAAAGLSVGRTLSLYRPEGGQGTVVAQRPAAGALLERNAVVDLFLAKERSGQRFVMPDLVQRDYEYVRRFFESKGFRMGRVSYESYAGVEPGTILRQYPLAGHPLHEGEIISLWVVAGEQTPESLLR